MTRDELLSLPISQLVNYVLEYQMTIEQLHKRVAELEGQMGGKGSDSEHGSQPDDRVVATGRVEILPDSQVEHKSVHRHRRHHRPWYRKLLRSFSAEGSLRPTYLMIGLVIILLAAVLAVLLTQPNLSLGGLFSR